MFFQRTLIKAARRLAKTGTLSILRMLKAKWSKASKPRTFLTQRTRRALAVYLLSNKLTTNLKVGTGRRMIIYL